MKKCFVAMVLLLSVLVVENSSAQEAFQVMNGDWRRDLRSLQK